MIKNNQYTREAWQEIENKILENGDIQKFIVKYYHYNGFWCAGWELITEQKRNGYMSRLSIPTADYNGRTRIQAGRFSASKLQKLESVLYNNKDKYFNLWQQGKYQELCNELHADF